MFKDKNVIFILAESLDEIAIDKELTPTLYKMKNEGIIFNNYYSPKYPSGTADGEYMLEWGTLPVVSEMYSFFNSVYNKNNYVLPTLLKQYGYKTYAYHDYEGSFNSRDRYFPTLKYDKIRFCGDGIETECHNFHGSDLDMVNQSVNDFINEDKFYTFYVTVSGHGSYDSSNYIAQKNIAKLKDYDYPSDLKYYLPANIEFDLAMESLLNKLKENNKLDDTLIVISSDHSPYYLSDQTTSIRSKYDRSNKFDKNRGVLIAYNPKLKGSPEVNNYAMNIDVLPTIINMLGITYESKIIIGRDILAQNNEGVVIFSDGSWITNVGSYDNETKKFTKFISNIDDKYVSKVCQEVEEKLTISTNIQYNNYYKYVFK